MLRRFLRVPLNLYCFEQNAVHIRPFDAQQQKWANTKTALGIPPIKNLPTLPNRLPLGHLTDEEIVAIATQTGMPNFFDATRSDQLRRIISQYEAEFPFDTYLIAGLMMPTKGNYFVVPNGLSLNPRGKILDHLLEVSDGTDQIIQIAKGTQLPDSLVLLWEQPECYSLQPRVAMTLDRFDALVKDFLKQFRRYQCGEFYSRPEQNRPEPFQFYTE